MAMSCHDSHDNSAIDVSNHSSTSLDCHPGREVADSMISWAPCVPGLGPAEPSHNRNEQQPLSSESGKSSTPSATPDACKAQSAGRSWDEGFKGPLPLEPWTPWESAGPGPPLRAIKSQSVPSLLPPTILVEEAAYEKIGSVSVRKTREPMKSKVDKQTSEATRDVSVFKWDPGTRKRIDGFKIYAGASNIAKLHNANVQKAASKMEASFENKLAMSKSAEVLAISDCSKPFLKVSKPLE